MSREIYTRVKGLEIPSKTFEEIQGTSAMPDDTPFLNGHLAMFSVVSINGDISDDQEGVVMNRLVRISPSHGRSFKVIFNNTEGVYWADKYGNNYSSFTIKGGNLESPVALRQTIAPSGFVIHGLQDSDAMVRILRASNLIRSHHIETEMIVRVMQPELLPFDGQLVPLEEFKKRIVRDIWTRNADENSGNITREEIPRLRLALEGMTFFLSVRGHQVAERLMDLTQPENQEMFRVMMTHVLDYVNRVEEMKTRKDSSYQPQYFDPDKDVVKYLTEYLPARIAINYARMHNLGLVHVYPHYGNISAVGSIDDLDSVRGEPLGIGDDPVTDSHIKQDLVVLLYGFNCSNQDGFLHMLDVIQKKGFIHLSDNWKNLVEEVFYKRYIQERGWGDHIVKDLPKILAFHDGFNTTSRLDDDLIAYYSTKMAGQLGWNYVYPEDYSQLAVDYSEEVYKGAKERFTDIKEGRDPAQKKAELEKAAVGRIEFFRYGYPMFRVLERDVRRQFGHELRKITETYGEEISDAVVVMHVLKYEKKAYREIGLQGDSDNQISYRYFQQAIRDEGWEEDILSHVYEIEELFEAFIHDESEEYLDHYLSLVCQALNFEFHYDEDIKEVLDEYMEFSRSNVEATFKIAAMQAPKGANLKALIESACIEKGFAQEITTLPWEQDNWQSFLNERLWPFTKDYDAVWNILAEKFGEDGEDIVGYAWIFITAKAEHILRKKYDPIIGIGATARQELEVAETVLKYLKNPKLALEKVKLSGDTE